MDIRKRLRTGQGWWSHVDFRFWNLDCGLKKLETKCEAGQSVFNSKIRILKSKL
jgi:hypothetical protein